MTPCLLCDDDGYVAYPTWADDTKKLIRIQKVRCPNGCPLANPDEEGVLAERPGDHQ